MDASPPPLSNRDVPADAVSNADPRLKPTPDYGTLGPDSDIGGAGNPISRTNDARQFGPVFAVALGMLLAVLVATGKAHTGWPSIANLFASREPKPASPRDSQLDRMKPQKQAEALLEMAVARSDGATDQISSRVDRWQGKVKWDAQISTLTTAALNSNDMRVRESGIEVELAAYGLSKNSASLDYLLRMADSPDHAQKVWALWALGLMGNRGVETDQVIQVLSAHLKDADEDSRRWAVEGLALTGSSQTIETLLKTMHDDPAPSVRERAACGIAEAGMFTPEQRYTAVPQLLNYTNDPALDAQTHAWSFQALGDITHQRLPSDSAAWRNWYASTKTE